MYFRIKKDWLCKNHITMLFDSFKNASLCDDQCSAIMPYPKPYHWAFLKAALKSNIFILLASAEESNMKTITIYLQWSVEPVTTFLQKAWKTFITGRQQVLCELRCGCVKGESIHWHGSRTGRNLHQPFTFFETVKDFCSDMMTKCTRLKLQA